MNLRTFCFIRSLRETRDGCKLFTIEHGIKIRLGTFSVITPKIVPEECEVGAIWENVLVKRWFSAEIRAESVGGQS